MKCVLTVAGLGTRLLPLTKELPKEMLPIYVKSMNEDLVLKPILQVIFESLYDYNLRDFCFIVGRTKRAVEDHFTPDFDLVKHLRKDKKGNLAKGLEVFFKKLEKSNIIFSIQPKPSAFEFPRKKVPKNITKIKRIIGIFMTTHCLKWLAACCSIR